MPTQAEIEAAVRAADVWVNVDDPNPPPVTSLTLTGRGAVRGFIVAALEAAERARWQPIETAPKGEMFIYSEPRDGKRCIGLAYWTVTGEWRDSESEWTRRLNPTRWMPLPYPP